jgi:RNA polymerase sigma factor (sigma-70 family)
MKARTAEPLLRDIQALFRTGATGGLTDGELLARFVASGDEAAFEVLVHRLGPMVLGVCRRMLNDRHDAEDAFQATFLVLARRAASVEPPDRVGPWLYGVARRVADRARAVRARRRMRESAASGMPEPAIEPSRHDDLLPLLDRELGRLPEKYRAPIVLCHLEGKPYKEAARQLGCPEGTLAGRLTRGRALLAARLNRLGVAMSAGALANLMAKEASARVPAAWAASAAGTACGITGGAPSAVAAGVAALANSTLRTMLMTRLRVASAAIVAVGVIGVGAAAGRGDDPKPAPKEAAEARHREGFLRPGAPVDLAQFAYEIGRDVVIKADGAALKRVEAYRIGDDLYVNVAPPGSGRVLLEKVTNRPAPVSDPAQAKRAPAAKPENGADSRATAQERVVQALEAIRSGQPDVLLVDGKANPADPTAAGRLYEILVEGREQTGDAQLARRLYLDLLGRVPTDDEVKAYVDSGAPDKAEVLARRLVDDPAAVEQIKRSLLRRAAARVAQTRRAAAKPVTFTLADATLDRVNLPAGDLIDVHLDNGPHDPTNPAADQQTTVGLHDGQLISTVSPPATRILGLAVAVGATLRIESAEGVVTTETGERMLGQLKPGMRLTLEIVAEGSMLAVRSITARPAPQLAAVSYDLAFPYVYPEVKPAAPQP